MQSAPGNAQEPADRRIHPGRFYQLYLRISRANSQKRNSHTLQGIRDNSLIPNGTWEGADEARHGRRNVSYNEAYVVKTKVAGSRRHGIKP